MFYICVKYNYLKMNINTSNFYNSSNENKYFSNPGSPLASPIGELNGSIYTPINKNNNQSPIGTSNPSSPKMNNFYISDYYIEILYTFDSSINMYVKNVNNNYIYEGNIDIKSLNSPFNNEETYHMILNFLGKRYNSSISIDLNANTFFLRIDYSLNNSSNANFILKVPMKNNELNSFIKKNNEEINMMKQYMNKFYQYIDTEIKNQKKEYQNKIEEQKKMFETKLESQKNEFDNKLNEINSELIEKNYLINNLINCVEIKINRFIPSKNTTSPVFVPLNSTEINISYPIDLDKLKYFSFLEKLTIQLSEESIEFENNTVKHIIFNGGRITSIKGIEKVPLVEILEFHYCSHLQDVRSFLNNTNIKKIIFLKCTDGQKRNMENYCKAKNIELIFQ